MTDTILVPWGKYDPSNPSVYHPLLYHMIDTANVATRVFDSVLSDQAKHIFSKVSGLDKEQTSKWIGALAGSHDIGKATPGFQGIVEPHKIILNKSGFSLPHTEKDHALLTAVILRRLLSEHMPYEGGLFSMTEVISKTLGAHHGKFIHPARMSRVLDDDVGDLNWQLVQKELFESLLKSMEVYGSPKSAPLTNEERSTFVMLLAGLTTFSDWIASNSEYFPYLVSIPSIEEYSELSKSKAEAALGSLHLHCPRTDCNEGPTFSELFPEIVEPNELQMACMNLIQGQTAPGLLVIEAPMGEGKTEAALFCMASWNLTSGHKGCFIALPTQATANQMFTRLNLFLGNYVNGPKAQLVLVHGKALLSDNYLELRMNSSKGAKPDDKVVAEEWFSYKKRGLLSPFGVGTVDQVLLASLHTKHFYLRMFGLAGKTVIIDEVHSYDLYTGTILDHTLNWLSALKANVILMSATLPTSRLEKLANSYSPGCSLNKIEYPCVRLINDEGARSVTFHTMSQKDHRRIQEIFLRWFDNNDSLYDYFLNRSDTSGSFAIIVNTVDEAQTIYTCLRPLEKMGYDVMLLHSRFIFKRRDELERRAISKFDKHSIGMSRNGILVSTQIIEQSLDLDFDSIYTKLAPIDLVLQRAGRLHRHVREGRPADLDAPVLNIILPKMVDDQPDFGKDIFVYDEYVLLRTWLFLRDQERIVLPSDLRVGVESVYGPLASSVDERIADRLDRARAQMQRWEDGVREKASHRLVVPPNSEIVWTRHDDLLNDGVNDSEDEVQGLTRLGRPSIEVILLFDNGHEPCLDPDGNAPLSALDASSSDYARIILDNSLRLSNHDVVTSMMAIPKEERHWTDDSLLRSYTPLVMHKVAGNWTHRLGEVLLVYDHDVGMRYAKVI